jgi:hypothetical protein
MSTSRLRGAVCTSPALPELPLVLRTVILYYLSNIEGAIRAGKWEEVRMRLTPPKKSVFWISIVLVIVGVLLWLAMWVFSLVQPSNLLNYLSYWLPVVGFLLLALGNAVKGI